jgi:predicted GH43/DUF377 family glycosyl hydrolase
MTWTKRGRVFGPDGSLRWAQNSALTPTPLLFDDDTIRVYAGMRDENGVSRIGWVDVDAADPTRVRASSREPALDVGRAGAFDDNGVILGDVLRVADEIWMYYVGFQLVAGAKFLAFSGLAKSRDGGARFERHSEAPVLDRADGALYINAIHSVRREDGRFRVFCAQGDGWETIDGRPYPRYRIAALDSDDGMRIDARRARTVIDCEGDEYRIGRPRVYRDGGEYRMYYTRGTRGGDYVAGLARSDDGVHWKRDDARLGIAPSAEGWDSRALAYPALVDARGRRFMFYNGNDMGREGFGLAEWTGGDA